MSKNDRLMTVAQVAAIARVSITDLRKVLRAAPVGISFIVRKRRMVDYGELMAWMRTLPVSTPSRGRAVNGSSRNGSGRG